MTSPSSGSAADGVAFVQHCCDVVARQPEPPPWIEVEVAPTDQELRVLIRCANRRHVLPLLGWCLASLFPTTLGFMLAFMGVIFFHQPVLSLAPVLGGLVALAGVFPLTYFGVAAMMAYTLRAAVCVNEQRLRVYGPPRAGEWEHGQVAAIRTRVHTKRKTMAVGLGVRKPLRGTPECALEIVPVTGKPQPILAGFGCEEKLWVAGVLRALLDLPAEEQGSQP